MTDSSIEKALRVAQRCANLAAKVPIAGEPDPLWWERQAALGDAADKINELIALPSPEREPMREALERALRIRIWNECKEKGMCDEDASKRINAEIEGIKTEALAPPSAQSEDRT